jgi:putative ABC transport system substrate-binding protein
MSSLLRNVALAGLLLATEYGMAAAEGTHGLPRIGGLYMGSPSVQKPYEDALKDGLRSLGYVDGKTVAYVARYANGDSAQFPRLARELIEAKVDALVVSTAGVQAAMQATQTIPIIAPSLSDPIRDGLVTSLAHPGGNLTGGTGMGPDTDSKRLQFAMELIPGLKRIGLLYDATNPQFENGATANRLLANGLGLTLHTYGVRDVEEIRSVFARLEKDRIQALMVWPTPLMLVHRQSILDATSHKIPVIAEGTEYVQSGALISYSADYIEMWRHAAVHVFKILKGSKPGDLPIERPTKFVLRVNLKAAKELGVTIPESILARADEVIR